MASFKAVTVDMNKALDDFRQYKYGLIFYISEKILARTEEIEFNLEECLEARFFSEDRELHIFDFNGERKAAIVEDAGEEYMDKKYKLANAHKNLGDSITVRRYLDYDDDGQVYIAATRLVGIE